MLAAMRTYKGDKAHAGYASSKVAAVTVDAHRTLRLRCDMLLCTCCCWEAGDPDERVCGLSDLPSRPFDADLPVLYLSRLLVLHFNRYLPS